MIIWHAREMQKKSNFFGPMSILWAASFRTIVVFSKSFCTILYNPEKSVLLKQVVV